MRFRFDPEKLVEAVLYVTGRTDGDLYNTMKIFYVADKWHLERFGSLIFGGRYAHLPYGPVPSETYDLLKGVRGDRPLQDDWEQAANAFSINYNTISPLREVDMDLFSRSDVAALDQAIEDCGHMTFGQIKELTHDAAYDATTPGAFISLDAIAATLANGPDVIQHLADPHPGAADEC